MIINLFKKDKPKTIRDHHIEQILLRAHGQKEVGIDLIEEYFQIESSLDLITKRAWELLQEHRDPNILQEIRKNLSECIVVKNQIEMNSVFGRVRKLFCHKSGEIRRAEKVLESI